MMKTVLLCVGSIGLLCLGRIRLDAQMTLPQSSLAAYIVELKTRIPGAGSEAFVEPSLEERESFVPCMQMMLLGDVGGAVACMTSLNYDLNYLTDSGFGKTYLVVEERSSGFKGLGTYIADPDYARNIVIAVPHPLYEVNTPEEGQRIFQEIGARGLFIAGTHRCANSAPSPCLGSSSVCGGGPYKISDAAHFHRNFMHAAHKAALGLNPPPMAFNIHGQSSEPVDIVLSDGTAGSAPSSADVNRLRESLLLRGVSVGSCNWQGDTGLSLCGTINTEGGLYNNSPDPCSTVSTIPSGLFFHLEQKRNIRDNPSLLIEAMKDVFPLSVPAPPPAPVDLVAAAGNAQVILSWTAASAAAGYNVYRSLTAEAPGSEITSGVASTTYTDLSLVNGTTYYYFVTAVNAGGESAASNKVSATPTLPQPPAPGGLKASGFKRRIVLGWNGSTGAASYKVKRGTTSGGPYTTITEGVMATSYTDSSVERGLTYYYVVTAVNGSGESASSNQASAAPR